MRNCKNYKLAFEYFHNHVRINEIVAFADGVKAGSQPSQNHRCQHNTVTAATTSLAARARSTRAATDAVVALVVHSANSRGWHVRESHVAVGNNRYTLFGKRRGKGK